MNNTIARRHHPARRGESGWVLAASLILATLAGAVTVTYARHAVLAKKSLEFAKGASEVEEATRSGLQRVRERMRDGDLPGTTATGTHDYAVTPTGEEVTGERVVVAHDEREIRVRARAAAGGSTDDEAQLRARSRVVPGSGDVGERTRLKCETGTPLLLAGNLQIISGDVAFQGVEMAGLFLLEAGAHLTLQDVILRGTIVTRAGLCKSQAPAVGSNRPRVTVYGGLRLLAGTELPEVAMAAPDLRFEADESSRLEIRGYSVVDEFDVKGRGSVRGMVTTCSKELIGSNVRRPGHGRAPQEWPDSIDAGAERVTYIGFPRDPVPEATLDVMASAEID